MSTKKVQFTPQLVTKDRVENPFSEKRTARDVLQKLKEKNARLRFQRDEAYKEIEQLKKHIALLKTMNQSSVHEESFHLEERWDSLLKRVSN